MTEPAAPPRIFKANDLLSVPEFARRLGISRSHAYELVSRGQAGGGVYAFRFGETRCLRVPLGEVERFKQAQVVECV